MRGGEKDKKKKLKNNQTFWNPIKSYLFFKFRIQIKKNKKSMIQLELEQFFDFGAIES